MASLSNFCFIWNIISDRHALIPLHTNHMTDLWSTRSLVYPHQPATRLTANSYSGVGPSGQQQSLTVWDLSLQTLHLMLEGSEKKGFSTQERCWSKTLHLLVRIISAHILLPRAQCSGSSRWPVLGSWSYEWPLGRVCTLRVEGISLGGTEMGLPTMYAHCQGHRRTEEALLVLSCPKPVMKPRGAPFNPHTQCIFSAEVPLAAEVTSMTGQEERESWGKESKIPTRFWHRTTAQKWMNYLFLVAMYFCGYLLA